VGMRACALCLGSRACVCVCAATRIQLRGCVTLPASDVAPLDAARALDRRDDERVRVCMHIACVYAQLESDM
jgi:hypothetical protein